MGSVYQFFLYSCVGAFAAIINLTSFYSAWHLLHLNYQFSASLAYILSVIGHFAGNRYLTFSQTPIDIYSQMKRYIVLVIVNYFVTLATITVVVSYLHLSPYFGIIIAIGFTVGIGFLISQRYIFREMYE